MRNNMAKKERRLGAPPTERDVKDAVAVIQRDYYDDVETLGDELMGRIKDGEIPDRDAFSDALHETIDGSRRVFVTWLARLGLLATSNYDAYFEEGIGDLDCSESVPYETLMFYALQQDVVEYMQREGVDPFDDDTYEEEEDED